MRKVSLTRLFGVFAAIGITSIGGGRLALLYDVLVERRGWLTREEFLPGFALCNLLPGPTVSNLSVFLGNSLRGWRGAVLGLLGILLPGVVCVLALSVLYFHFGLGPGLNAALRGMAAAVVGYLCIITEKMTRGAFGGHGAAGVLIAAATFFAVGVLHLNTFAVVAVVAVVALWIYRPRETAPDASVPEAPR